jgi:hypothetical protein
MTLLTVIFVRLPRLDEQAIKRVSSLPLRKRGAAIRREQTKAARSEVIHDAENTLGFSPSEITSAINAAVKKLSGAQLDRFTNRIADLSTNPYFGSGERKLIDLYQQRGKIGKLTPKHVPMLIKHAQKLLKEYRPGTASQIMKVGLRYGAINKAHSKQFLTVAEQIARGIKFNPVMVRTYSTIFEDSLLDEAIQRGVLTENHVKPLIDLSKKYSDYHLSASSAFLKAAIAAGKLDPAKYKDAFLNTASRGYYKSPLERAVVLAHGIESGALKASDPEISKLFSAYKQKADVGILTLGHGPAEAIPVLAKRLGVKISKSASAD